ncbi:MAG: excinuclease ABC subunit UvrC [Alcaligenaceae bacterium]|nr:excinuclease ABC subunit UvrC [Alcaligenaceae bacterium]
MNEDLKPRTETESIEQFQQSLPQFLKNLPHLPGVYQHINTQGKVLYVGKAKDLKKRVSQYFRKNLDNPRIELMVSQVAKIDYSITRSEAEALILENNLIKEHRPRFNILFRDDKSYPYLMFSSGDFPRVAYYRGLTKKNAQFFGPYPNSWAVKESIQILQKIFKLRSCEESVFKNRSRPCLLAQIKRCSAPCVGHISQKKYQEDVQKAVRFLRGDSDHLIHELESQMTQASEIWDFESASIYRDQIQALSKIRHQQSMENTGEKNMCDIIAVASLEHQYVVNLSMVREGLYLGDKSFFPKQTQDQSPSDVLSAFVAQHYVEHTLPKRLVLSHPLVEDNLIKLIAEQQNISHKISHTYHPKNIQKKWLDLTKNNAQLAIAQRLQQTEYRMKRTLALAQILNLETDEDSLDQLRIECFDISHTSGEATQASCVVYEHHDMNSSAYRRFNIHNITAGDDYAAMKQALTRRYHHLLEKNERMPDIVLIDGGLGQMNVAIEVFDELGLSKDCLVGIKKGDHRKVGLETLLFANGRDNLTLGVQSDALMLLAMVRDEAHRFAITGMRKKRDQQRKRSTLEDIPGVGPKRRQRLLNRFGGLSKVANASVEDLCQVEGISKALAEEIYARLR